MDTTRQASMRSFAASAAIAASYLDACDGGGRHVQIDPEYYQACARLLLQLFTVYDACKSFPDLMESSAAARELAESVLIGQQLATSQLVYYPQLAAVLRRVAG